MGPPPSRRPEAAPHYPSLERSARKKQKPSTATSLSTAAILQAALRPESRSMENLGKRRKDPILCVAIFFFSQTL
jgi:hypothetical protein